jgi:hypothetical protein
MVGAGSQMPLYFVLERRPNHMQTCKESGTKQLRRRPPATTPEARENQMISLAVDLAEKQIINGTASSQIITHFLKLGSIKEQKELALLEQELELKKAKTEAIQSGKRVEELYLNALNAMRSYTGSLGGDEDD